MKTMLPIARSDIHAHLTQEHVEVLFGKGHRLAKWRDLTIPGAYACHETVEVRGPSGSIGAAVVVGPCRSYPQVEVSLTTAAALCIAALRHIHMNTSDARVDPSRALEMHVDFDEGYAAGAVDFQLVELIR